MATSNGRRLSIDERIGRLLGREVKLTSEPSLVTFEIAHTYNIEIDRKGMNE